MPGGKEFLSALDKIAVSGENYRFFTVWDKNLLEIGGKILSSEDFALELNEIINSGVNELVFVIGSSHGLSQKISQRADYKLSLSRMTFLHNFARLILVEQIYRAFKIIKGETYHK